jgi:hypothetical protein
MIKNTTAPGEIDNSAVYSLTDPETQKLLSRYGVDVVCDDKVGVSKLSFTQKMQYKDELKGLGKSGQYFDAEPPFQDGERQLLIRLVVDSVRGEVVAKIMGVVWFNDKNREIHRRSLDNGSVVMNPGKVLVHELHGDEVERVGEAIGTKAFFAVMSQDGGASGE